MFAPGWSGKLEYLYMDLGTVDNSAVLATGVGFSVSGQICRPPRRDNIFRAGINYHFSPGPGPVVARY